jgi:hypothetical protein
MDRKGLPPPRLHYHIRWSSKEALDWERFASRVEAEERAKELVRPGETYILEEHEYACPRCAAGFESKPTDVSPKSPEMKYPDWQTPLFDVLIESDPNQLHDKIGRAEGAIRKRLLELSRTTGNQEEIQAIQDALRSLGMLFSNAEPKKKSA